MSECAGPGCTHSSHQHDPPRVEIKDPLMGRYEYVFGRNVISPEDKQFLKGLARYIEHEQAVRNAKLEKEARSKPKCLVCRKRCKPYPAQRIVGKNKATGLDMHKGWVCKECIKDMEKVRVALVALEQ